MYLLNTNTVTISKLDQTYESSIIKLTQLTVRFAPYVIYLNIAYKSYLDESKFLENPGANSLPLDETSGNFSPVAPTEPHTAAVSFDGSFEDLAYDYIIADLLTDNPAWLEDNFVKIPDSEPPIATPYA